MTTGANAISARSIRELVREGKSIRYLVPDAVERFIAAHSLYGAKA
jgi:nicotinic acid mononucleotide adenylyltransferase